MQKKKDERYGKRRVGSRDTRQIEIIAELEILTGRCVVVFKFAVCAIAEQGAQVEYGGASNLPAGSIGLQ